MMKFPFLALNLILLVTYSSAQVRETPVTLGLIEGGNPQGYVQNSNDQGILFATTQGGSGQMVPYAKIRGEGLAKLIRFDDRIEVMGVPRALFAAGKYTEAAEAFGKVAKDYAIILAVPDNFASESLFYQIESLRRAGQYAAMPALVDAPVAATIPTKLSEAYQRIHEFQKLWALLGANKMDDLKAALAVYEEPVTGNGKLLSVPNFKKAPTSELSQLSFLRAKVYDAAGEKEKALEEYYRTFTLAYGNDLTVTKLAMGAAMVMQKEDPLLTKGDPKALAQMQSIAYLFSLRFGADIMPEGFKEYAVRPPMPKLAPAPANKEEAPAGEEKKAVDPKAPAPEAAAPKADDSKAKTPEAAKK